MMRRILAVVSVLVIGMFGAGGVAAAAAPYPAPPTVTITITINGVNLTGNITVTVGVTIIISGDGFDPGEGIDGNVSYLGPNGLRSTLTASRLAAPMSFSATAVNDGHFDQQLTLDQVGTDVITATGQSSGKSGSIAIQVTAAGATQTGGGTTIGAVGATQAGGGTTIAGAAGSGSNESGSGLARTGVSIAGPLMVGLAALFVGLALLFFGTRGVIRRKSSKSLGDA